MREFFAMGGYAPYIWGSYGLALLVLVALLVASLLALRAKSQTLAALEAASPRRRQRKAEAPGGDGGEAMVLMQAGASRGKAAPDDASPGDGAGDGSDGSGGDGGGGE